MGKMPTRESQLKAAVNEYSKNCPVYFENGLSLDSINLGQPSDLNYYLSDKTSADEHIDSTHFVTMMTHFYKEKSVDPDFKRFLNLGYKINFILFRKDSSVIQLKLDLKTFADHNKEI